MMYLDFEVGNKNYKLRLNTRNTIVLEKQIGCNPLAIFGDDGNDIPTITTMVAILYSSLQQYNHGITLNDAYDIFDNWLSEGNSVTDFLPIIIDIFKASGIIKNDSIVEENEFEKN